MSSKESSKLIKSPPPVRRSPVPGEKPDVINYTQCVCLCVSLSCTVRSKEKLPEAWGLEMGRGGSWMKAISSSKYLSYHAHTQCYRHISPDSYDEPSRFMQKIVSFLPTALQLKWIFISVTSSSYPWYLPASHSSILHVYIPLVFPLFLPSFLSTSSPFFFITLTVGVLAPWKGRGNDGRGGNETQRKRSQSGAMCVTFSLVI